MKHFTPKNMQYDTMGNQKPRALTLDIIREVAYTYRSNTNGAYCLN